jgi:N-acetyl-gamma-glutamyl-phosphate reductase
MTAKVFIDGEAGTTGLQIRQRLENHAGIEIVSIDPARRKDRVARAELLNSVDVAILCLPDDGAREAISLIETDTVRVIDASTAFRTAPGWVYGFPEMTQTQRHDIAGASRVTNAGCYATGSVAILRPLVDAEILPGDGAVSIIGVSGYSGGGRGMIAEFEDSSSPIYTTVPFRLYGLGLTHKHVPEIQAHAGLERPPLFAPAVGRFAQGMIVEVPLDLNVLPGTPCMADVHATLADAYANEPFVTVVPLAESGALATLSPEALNGTNNMNLHVFGSAENSQILVVSTLDNLGKGASGQAVQNLNIMLDLPEADGLLLDAA